MSYSKIAHEGLWKNNPAMVQLLGLCPLLATSSTVINATGMALATLVVVVLTNVLVSLIRSHTRKEVRIPIFVMIIAAAVTAVELFMNAYLHELFLRLGIFIPLITTNCMILGRAEAFASKNTVQRAAFDGLMMGAGFGVVLIALGALREALGQGTLLAGADMLFGAAAAEWTLTLVPGFEGWLLAALPPGAFIGLGFLVAGKQWLDQRAQQRAQRAPAVAATSEASAR
ncbi:electron transport complex subunit E [Algiphilus sp.]|uniref:electron transport complex subunit E n=1 Tax=Algiphilus sp. TaxID=1872431 RepID=UPI001CA6F361|nr:electron transport complex subunit E [Algiphilus acroporae]MCR9091015.1 electron transport complex subunit E [Pseudomonadota bacterium]